jgi:hypothetical protein
MKQVFIRTMVVLLAIQSSAAHADPLVESLVRSIGAIRTISAEFEVTINPSPAISGARKVNGRDLFYRFRWLYDRSKGWQLFDGEYGMVDESRWTYAAQIFAWDGIDYIAYTPKQRRALKSGDPWFSFAGNKSPAVLIGDNILSRFSIGLPELLNQAVNVRSEADQISAEFDWQLMKGSPTHKILIDVTPGTHTLPRRISLTELSSGVDVVVVEVDGFTEDTVSGLKFPISGSLENFQVTELPDGSFGKYSLGVGKMHISIDPRTLSVNEPIDRARFSVELPADVLWHDERTGETFEPEGTSINDVPKEMGFRVALFSLVLVVVVAVSLIFLRRK